MQVSLTDLVGLTGWHRNKIARLLAGQPCESGEKGAKLYEAHKVLPLLYGGADGIDPARERALLDKTRREQIETRMQAERGSLLAVDEVAEVWRTQVQTVKERLLSIPARVAPALLRANELRDIELTLREALNAVLDELSREPSSAVAQARPAAPADDGAASAPARETPARKPRQARQKAA